ncbi:MAG: UDP-N-acetylmuramoyl-L-alanyl-D-glutamate--2,6-diaminopimelate ligase [Elusimicrobia bacterium]|nr:UDP-N-acetylmuramoyl-L-alanyl-D-glutamate--2,6-diaminopimelate ligase [Elusimicrobiota bacterium]
MNDVTLLKDLLTAAGIEGRAGGDTPIRGLSYDSRLVQPGDLFFAIKGAHVDGHAFLAEAARRGAVAAVVEEDTPSPIPIVRVPSVLAAMSKLSDAFFGRPSEKLPVIGVTGTNGKTTTTFLIEDLFRARGKTCGVLGTVNYRIGNEISPAPNTTPMSLDVHRFFRDCLNRRAAAAVMEVSSHALALNRVDTVRFAVAVFTNLTQDHLDFHKTMEDYFQAKARLFKRREPVKSAVNIDDEYGRRLAAELPSPLTYGFSPAAALRADDPQSDLMGLRFTLRFPSGRSHAVSNNLLGRHNIQNCLSAAGAMFLYGQTEEEIVVGLNRAHAVPGRLERVDAGQPFVVAVDYAHTHDALDQVLTTLRNTGPRKLICVFGAGGDRDKTKRPKMGAVATTLSDRVIVTSDNPRTEDPKQIIRDIEAGIQAVGKSNYVTVENREEAIRRAIREAEAGDIVLIAGKGHENYQIYGTQKTPFSDVEAARRALSE